MNFVNVGIDLAIKGSHWAAVLDDGGETLVAPFSLARSKQGLDRLWERVQKVLPEGHGVRVVLEPTGWQWLPVAVYLAKKGAIIVRPSTTETADLRRFYRRHAKSDRIDTRVLARLPLIKPESMPVMKMPNPRLQALWRLCKQRQRMVIEVVGIKKRVSGMVEVAIPGITKVFANALGPAARAIYQDYLNPWRACEAGTHSTIERIKGLGSYVHPFTTHTSTFYGSLKAMVRSHAPS